MHKIPTDATIFSPSLARSYLTRYVLDYSADLHSIDETTYRTIVRGEYTIRTVNGEFLDFYQLSSQLLELVSFRELEEMREQFTATISTHSRVDLTSLGFYQNFLQFELDDIQVFWTFGYLKN